MNFFYYEFKPKIKKFFFFFFGRRGVRCEARVSEFYFTKNPNLKRGRGWVGGGELV